MTDAGVFSADKGRINELIDGGSVTVCVIGIGRIGLPTALSFANSGFTTIGVDINEELVAGIKDGDFPLKDEPGYGEIFDLVTGNGRFSATTKIEEAVPHSQIILLSLPTPMDQENVPDYSALNTVGRQLKRLVSPGSVIVIESTVEPGFVENEFIRLVEDRERGIVIGRNVGVGVCPETANPGEISRDFQKLPRLIGSTDRETTQIIAKIYGRVFPVEIIEMPDCKTANAVKLTTNVFRDINIAFVNELAILFEKLGIDTNTVLEHADKKYNFQVHYPGAGVGGPCLPVNSYQMLNSARKMDGNLKIVEAGRRVNEGMPFHVIEMTKDALNEAGKQPGSSDILILGISYKPDIKDIQLSPAAVIVSELRRLGCGIRIFDPYFKGCQVYGIRPDDDLEYAISQADVAIIVTAHKEFKGITAGYFASKMKSPILIDARGMINMQEARRSGLIFRGLGRGRS